MKNPVFQTWWPEIFGIGAKLFGGVLFILLGVVVFKVGIIGGGVLLMLFYIILLFEKQNHDLNSCVPPFLFGYGLWRLILWVETACIDDTFIAWSLRGWGSWPFKGPYREVMMIER